jgi:4-amino-4-deoxy-L-arabinose transferase-like glycosyltransferase
MLDVPPEPSIAPAAAAPTPPAPWRLLLVLLLLDAAVVLPTLGTRTLWQIDEARYAQVAREMAETGDWLVPRIGGKVYACYPPLAYWAVAGSGTLFGWSEWSVRLPAALAGVLLVGLCGWLAWRLTASRLAAAAAAVALATTFGFVSQQITARADTLVALFATAALLVFEGIAREGARPCRLIAFYACVALGVLSKGPLGIVLPGLVAGAWTIARRRWDWIAAMKPWWGLPAVLLAVAPWYLVLARAGGSGALSENLLMENVEAFLSGHSHPQPVYFYLVRLPVRALPWILLLAAYPWMKRARREAGYALIGALAVFLFLSVSTSKRLNYLTYLYPLLAVSTGIALSAAIEDARIRRAAAWVLIALAAVAALGAAGFIYPTMPWKAEVVKMARTPLAVLALFVATALAVCAWTVRKGHAAATLGGLGLALAGLIYVGNTVFLPRQDGKGLHGKAFCRSIGDLVPPSETIAAVGRETKAMYYYYIPRRMVTIDALPAFQKSGLRYGFSHEADRPVGVETLASYGTGSPDEPRQVLWRRSP